MPVKRVSSVIFFILMVMVNVSFAKEIAVTQDINEVTRYKASQRSGGFFSNKLFNFNKIIRADKTYYYIDVSRTSFINSAKDFTAKAQMIIDGTPKELEKIQVDENSYLIPQESIVDIQNAKTLQFIFPINEKKTFQLEIKPDMLQSIQKSITLEKRDFIRNGVIYDIDPQMKSYPGIRQPQIYIPNMTPEQLVNPLVYYTNHKEYRPFYGLFCFTAFGSSNTSIQFAERYEYDGAHLAIHALLEPYHGGTFINTEVGSLIYSTDHGYKFVDASNRSGNRSSVEQFQRILNLLMEQAYGVYDYGIVIQKKDESGQGFAVASLNGELFSDIREAKLLAIDGIPAKDLFKEDIEKMTKYGDGRARTFTLQTPSGEKTITVTPTLDTTGKKPLETLKPDIRKGLPYKGAEPVSTIFDPLAQ